VLTVPELREHVQALEQHIAAALNDFSDITGTSVEDLKLIPIARYGHPTTRYYIQISISV
jgi:hypothetical protein